MFHTATFVQLVFRLHHGLAAGTILYSKMHVIHRSPRKALSMLLSNGTYDV